MASQPHWRIKFPPTALSVDEDTFLVAVEAPHRKDVIVFSAKDRKEIGACAFRDSHIVSLCFDPTGKRYFAAAIEGDRMLLSAVDRAASSVRWSREIPRGVSP